MSEISSYDAWHQIINAADEDTLPVSYMELGFTMEEIARMSTRGIALVEASTLKEGDQKDAIFVMRAIPSTPAGRFSENLNSDELSDEERMDHWIRFYKDVRYDADDDHFRAQYAELF